MYCTLPGWLAFDLERIAVELQVGVSERDWTSRVELERTARAGCRTASALGALMR